MEIQPMNVEHINNIRKTFDVEVGSSFAGGGGGGWYLIAQSHDLVGA